MSAIKAFILLLACSISIASSAQQYNIPFVPHAVSGGPLSVVSRATTGCTLANPATINMPATVNSGDLLLAFIYIGENSVSITTPPSGWTTIFTQLGSNSDGFLALFSKIADGTEDGTTISVTTNTAGQTYQAQSFAIANPHGATSSDIEYSVTIPGAVSNPNPPSLTPSWGSLATMWITGTAFQDDDEDVTTWPTGYDTNGISNSCGLGDNASANIALSYRIATAASEDPSAFTLSFTELTIAFTVGVRPQ